MTKGVVLVTGACGGIGRTCARDFGRAHSLFLTDIDAERLHVFAGALEEEGYVLAGTTVGDLSEPGVTEQIVGAARSTGPLASVVHTAGLSPALAGAEAILKANVVATERLLLALEADLEDELAAVLIASMAAHLARADADLDRLCAAPLADDFLRASQVRVETLVIPGMPFEPAATAYSQSKRAVLLMCQRRCAAWGERRARIVSVSPGTIWTPMGRKEAEANPAAAAVKDMAPMKRWGRPADIAAAVAFLASDDAGFITGTDLRVDGGVTPMLLGM